MPDPLSITTGVVGITVPALHGIRLLLEDLEQFKKALKTIKRLLEDVQSVDTSLQLLQPVEEREWDLLGASVAEELKKTISSCTQAYNSVRHTHITEDIKKIIATTQAKVKDAMTTTNKQLVVSESKLEELNLSNDNKEAAGPKEGKTKALRQLKEERKAVSASQRLLDELLSKTQEDAVAKAAAKNQGISTTVTSVTFGN
ncbi:uncharacterized protein BDZ99DRAFT_512429 [Mytilinidion resinicola]|uniref:Azaphilone pigments biosynthesis cluster protein L N-terminal domain-containing protein n=1 Tax=Mytilinidion resinicola TaxID=574789 RepID=A0A6A6Y1U2_9PEZI|nr:uncharacterized protein BDZ99DRAFT_512429 [Mytilinidion resinicola]KAF2802609.1 hypothetical protein BDZ99DRAFT_512429 [Mytilinidion resinicola]